MQSEVTAHHEPAATELRQQWIATLARAPAESVERHWQEIPRHPRFEWLRRPESGLVMVRGRIGGGGEAFNVGEITITRCALRITTSSVGARTGVGYVPGRARQHAMIAALVDALLQDPDRHLEMQERIIGPLDQERIKSEAAQAGQAAATRVEFRTVVRGG